MISLKASASWGQVLARGTQDELTECREESYGTGLLLAAPVHSSLAFAQSCCLLPLYTSPWHLHRAVACCPSTLLLGIAAAPLPVVLKTSLSCFMSSAESRVECGECREWSYRTGLLLVQWQDFKSICSWWAVRWTVPTARSPTSPWRTSLTGEVTPHLLRASAMCGASGHTMAMVYFQVTLGRQRDRVGV